MDLLVNSTILLKIVNADLSETLPKTEVGGIITNLVHEVRITDANQSMII